MRNILVTLILFNLTSSSYAQMSDTIISDIETAYRKYFSDFISRDFSEIASNFHVPAMLGVRSENYTVAKTLTAVEDFYKNAPLQEGYAYSALESIEIQRLTADVYYVETEFTRLGLTGDVLFSGEATYLYTMDSGEWKIFATMGAQEK